MCSVSYDAVDATRVSHEVVLDTEAKNPNEPEIKGRDNEV